VPFKSRLAIRLLAFLFAMIISSLQGVVTAQDAQSQSWGSWQSPVASPAGPYVAMTGQAIAFDASCSYSFDGPIIYYFWDFGDGTYGTGPNPNHQYMAEDVYTVTLTVCDDLWNCASSQSYATAGSVNVPARINFDELPVVNNLIVADQYLSQYGVRFYSGNTQYPTHTYQNCGFCLTTSPPNFINTKPDDAGIVAVEFTQPVNNLTFYMIGVDAFFNQFAVIDVYRSGNLYATYPVYGNGNWTVGFTLGSLTDISKVVIRNINDPLGIGFDDFTFNVPSDIKITSGRVGGYLNGTTQNALLGADVALQATPLPGGFAGGTYSWTCAPAPLCSIVAGGNSSSVNLRTLDTGTVTATVTYTKNNLTSSGTVTIDSVLPTVTSFAPDPQQVETIWAPTTCGTPDEPYSRWWFRKGCHTGIPGINFWAHVSVPTLLSDPLRAV